MTTEQATPWAPFRYYDAKDLSAAWGMSRPSVYQIPEAELPKRRVGPKRGLIVYLGADIIAYENNSANARMRAS